jgi:hypothetical protein
LAFFICSFLSQLASGFFLSSDSTVALMSYLTAFVLLLNSEHEILSETCNWAPAQHTEA